MMPRAIYRSAISRVKHIRDKVTPVTLYSKVGDSGESTRYIFLGWDRKLRYYWLKRISLESSVHKKRDWIRTSQVNRYLDKNSKQIDFAIVQSRGFDLEKFSYSYAYIIPRWMELILPTDLSRNRIRVKEVKRRIRKYEMKFDFRNTTKDLDLFYHKMYLPLLQGRHAGSAEFASYRMLEAKLNKGADLLFLSIGGEPIAAQLIEKEDDFPRILTFGVMNGDEEIVKMGVHGALYYYAIKNFSKHGYSFIRCGSSMPVVLDGVTQFKLRMGAFPYMQDLKQRSKYIVIPFGSAQGLKEMLKKNPLFHLSGNQLYIIWHVEPDDFHSKKEFLNLYQRIRCDNVERMLLYHFSDPRKIQRWIKEEGIESLELMAYEDKAG